MIGSLRVGGASVLGQQALSVRTRAIVQAVTEKGISKATSPGLVPPSDVADAGGPVEAYVSATAGVPQKTVTTVGKRSAPPKTIAGGGGASTAEAGGLVAPAAFVGAGGGGFPSGSAPAPKDEATFTVVSGEVPDGAVYAIVAALIGGAAYLLWRKYR